MTLARRALYNSIFASLPGVMYVQYTCVRRTCSGFPVPWRCVSISRSKITTTQREPVIAASSVHLWLIWSACFVASEQIRFSCSLNVLWWRILVLSNRMSAIPSRSHAVFGSFLDTGKCIEPQRNPRDRKYWSLSSLSFSRPFCVRCGN